MEPIESDWSRLEKALLEKFGDVDLQGILFLVGVQELGKGRRKFTKDQKLDVMHIAICTLLEPYGYYKYLGLDPDGWPHWEATAKLPFLDGKQQQKLIRDSLIIYFKEAGVI